MDIKDMDVKDIIEDWLKTHECDGLYMPGECACKIGDLFPCDICMRDCECKPGVLKAAGDEDGDFEWMIVEKST